MEDMRPGGVRATWADIEASRANPGFPPSTPIEAGVPRFVEPFLA